jgi:hypothetical protein
MNDELPLFKPEPLPSHERPLGRFFADAGGDPFHPLLSLSDAQTYPDGVVILQGDDGGQIYIVCPASQVLCSEAVLEILLHDLDELAWPGNDPTMRQIYYERCRIGTGIAGGMGGAVVTETVWIHGEFINLGLAPAIHTILSGQRDRLRSPSKE